MNIRINIAAWVGLTILVTIFGVVRKSPTYSLLKHYAVTQGRVSKDLPQSHGSFEFTYVVEHKVFTSVGFPYSEYLLDPKVGDPVIVHYDKANPENCTLDEPKVDFVIAIGGIVAQCAIIPLIAMMVLHHYKILPEWNLFKKIRLV